MEQLMESEDVKLWASGEVSEEFKYYFKENERDANWINVPFYFKGKLRSKLPTNIVAPFAMDFEFMEFFAGPEASANYDFDSLMVPFRCVASEIDSNKAVVLRRGSLSSAVRASMTYPFYFKPIQIDGKLLFDGGMYNNFPVDVAISDFNPDVIIGVKAAGNYGAPSQDNIISQIQNMLMENTNYSLEGKPGIIIEPELQRVNVIDFSKSERFIDSGYVETIRHMGQIEQLIAKRRTSSEMSAKRAAFSAKGAPMIIDTILISGLNKPQTIYVLKQLAWQSKQKLTLEELKKGYFRMLADSKIEFIYPKLKFNPENGYFDLMLDVARSEEFVAQFGGNISSSSINEAFVGLQYNFLAAKSLTLYSNAYFGRFYSSFKFTGRLDFPSQVPFFIELGYINNHKDFFKNSTYFLEDKEPSFLVDNDRYSFFQVGFPFRYSGKILTGVSLGRVNDEYYQVNTFTRNDTTDATNFDVWAPYTSFELNSLNRKQYATSGAKLKLTGRYVIGTEINIPGSTNMDTVEFVSDHQYFSFKLVYDNYFMSIRKVKLGFYSELYLSNQNLFHNYTSSILAAPAFQPIPESKTIFLPFYRAHNYWALGMKAIVPLMKNFNFRIEAYLMQPYRQISQDVLTNQAVYGEEFANRSSIGSASLVFHSPVGPISISVNYYDRTRDSFSVFFNFGYILFNNSIFD
jgi:NTE family protein